jgi:hypothetical protein
MLQRTVIVPTLDTLLPPGKNVIWCSSFQLAWNRLKNDVAKGPIQLRNAEPLADQLNQGNQREDDLESESVYTAAGLVKDGILNRIRSEMAMKFPDVSIPQLDIPDDGAVAYGYLAASVKFKVPYADYDQPFIFTDSGGNQSPVASFGIHKQRSKLLLDVLSQVQVLYSPRVSELDDPEIQEFVLDPCTDSTPYQIVLARVKPGRTLSATLADVQEKIKKTTGPSNHPSRLLIPNMNWAITHRFSELEGRDKQFQNPALRGRYLDTAFQKIRFKLDKGGAELSSEARFDVKSAAVYFHLNRPFLVYITKRRSTRPFFVMWVDNAELLCKQ